MHVATRNVWSPCGTDEEAMGEEATDEEAKDEEATDEEAPIGHQVVTKSPKN